ncbi:MAG: ATP-binding protein [Candidatus Sericytochromatia bacterium]
MPDSLLTSPDTWSQIASLARSLCDAGDTAERQACIRDTFLQLLGVREVHFFPIHRNMADIDDRPHTGTAAFLEYVAKLGQPVAVSGADLSGMPEARILPPMFQDPRWGTFLLAPVVLPGRAVGVLALADEGAREFDEAEVALLQAALPQIAGVLDAAILMEEAAYKDAYARALGEVDTMIASYDVTEILRFGVKKVYDTIEAEKVLVFIVHPETGVLRVSVAEGCPYAREGHLANEPCGALASLALKQRRAIQVGEAELGGLGDRREACVEKEALAVPIMANNHLFGVLEVFEKKNGLPFHRNEVAFVNQVATKLALVIQNTQAYMTINRLNEGLEQNVRERTMQLEQAITSLKETQAQLMQTEKLATIGTLAGGVAHELNNPLAAILASVQLLKLDIEDEEQMESLDIIETGAQRCKSIIEHLLNYARKAGPEHRSLSFNGVITETLELLHHQLRQSRVQVRTELGELPPVIGNLNELGQVVTNLVVNALDAIGEAGQGAGSLEIKTYPLGKHIVAEFKDNGCGIDGQALRKIFDPFYTTKQVGKGTGLGLSVSQQIMAAHSGLIEAASTRGQGSTFRLILPAAHGAARETGRLE